ncbi:MAG: copper resistance protein CopC [Gaiella sp.]
MRAAVGFACCAALALMLPAAAAAHATVSATAPDLQERLEAAPTEVRIRFDQAVAIGPAPIHVLRADGTELQGPALLRDDDRTVVVPVEGLRRGEAYTVRWRATSSDGHTIAGVYTFGVGVDPPPPTEAAGASGLTWRDDVARWALFVSVSVLVGGLALRLLVLPASVPASVEHRTNLLTTIAAFAAIDVGIVGLVLRSQNALQLPFVDLLYGDLRPFATKTSFGVAWMTTTLGFAVCAALLLLAWTLDRVRLRWPALALGLVLLTAFSLSGHQATEPDSGFLLRLADWLHLAAAALWVGGLALLAAVVGRLDPAARRATFLRFGRFATGLVAVLVIAGTVVALERLGAPSDLWETGYGRVLAVKIGLVVVALGWGAVHHLVVRPWVERGGVPGGRVGRSILGESVTAVAVLLAAAVLVNATPPPVEPADDARVAERR